MQGDSAQVHGLLKCYQINHMGDPFPLRVANFIDRIQSIIQSGNVTFKMHPPLS